MEIYLLGCLQQEIMEKAEVANRIDFWNPLIINKYSWLQFSISNSKLGFSITIFKNLRSISIVKYIFCQTNETHFHFVVKKSLTRKKHCFSLYAWSAQMVPCWLKSCRVSKSYIKPGFHLIKLDSAADSKWEKLLWLGSFKHRINVQSFKDVLYIREL